LEIERAAELQRLGIFRPDPAPEIKQVRPPHRESGAGHDAAAAVAEEHAPQNWRDVDRGVLLQLVYVVVFFAAAWANFATKDVTD